jgi:hypothetical protein
MGDLTTCGDVLYNYLEAYEQIPWPDLRYMFGEVSSKGGGEGAVPVTFTPETCFLDSLLGIQATPPSILQLHACMGAAPLLQPWLVYTSTSSYNFLAQYSFEHSHRVLMIPDHNYLPSCRCSMAATSLTAWTAAAAPPTWRSSSGLRSSQQGTWLTHPPGHSHSWSWHPGSRHPCLPHMSHSGQWAAECVVL